VHCNITVNHDRKAQETMADEADKTAESAEQAYAAAAEAVVAKPLPVIAPVTAKPAAKKTAPIKAPVAVKAVTPIPARKKSPAKAARPAPKKIVKPKSPSKKTTQSKEPKMATKTPDFMKTVTDAVSELQSKAKEAYDKGTAMTGEATEFAKGNVEALVEAGKIYSAGIQDLGKTYVDEAKSAFETLTADLKEIAAIKSPTELFQLQGKLARRNFDSLVAFSSKSSEAFVKLANEGFAPISGRVSLAAEKLSKAA